jgi:chromosome segregation ATPase
MGYKTVSEAIQRFEQREKEEQAVKKTMLDDYKNETKFIESLQKLIHEQKKTYRHCRYCCHAIKKEIKHTTREYRKILGENKQYLIHLEKYLDDLSHEANEKIKILKKQKNQLKHDPSNTTEILKLYNEENNIRFDTNKMLSEMGDFVRKIQNAMPHYTRYAREKNLLKEEKIRAIDIITIRLNRPILKFQEMVSGKYSMTLFASLSVISEVFGLLRYAMPDYYGLFYALKVGVDTPKEMIRANIGTRLS